MSDFDLDDFERTRSLLNRSDCGRFLLVRAEDVDALMKLARAAQRPRLTELEAQAVLRMDACIRIEDAHEALYVGLPVRDAWFALCDEARKTRVR